MKLYLVVGDTLYHEFGTQFEVFGIYSTREKAEEAIHEAVYRYENDIDLDMGRFRKVTEGRLRIVEDFCLDEDKNLCLASYLE